MSEIAGYNLGEIREQLDAYAQLPPWRKLARRLFGPYPDYKARKELERSTMSPGQRLRDDIQRVADKTYRASKRLSPAAIKDGKRPGNQVRVTGALPKAKYHAPLALLKLLAENDGDNSGRIPEVSAVGFYLPPKSLEDRLAGGIYYEEILFYAGTGKSEVKTRQVDLGMDTVNSLTPEELAPLQHLLETIEGEMDNKLAYERMFGID